MRKLAQQIATLSDTGEPLTPLEERLIELALVGRHTTVTGWAQAAGCSRQAIHTALKRPRFLSALRNAALMELHAALPAILQAAVNAACSDSPSDRRLLFEALGLFVPTIRAEVSGEGGGPVQFDFRAAVQAIHMEQARLEQGAGVPTPPLPPAGAAVPSGEPGS